MAQENPKQDAVQVLPSRAMQVYATLPDYVTPDVLSRKMGSKPSGMQIRRYLRDIFDSDGETRRRWVFSKSQHKDFLLKLITRLQSGSTATPLTDKDVAGAAGRIRV